MTEALQQEIRTLKNVFESERDPEGRAFAPLADAYRRAGEIQKAVRLLNEGLARHPQFVPGHVVAAQLYVEQGLAEEAAISARRALSLDGENVNAMRALLRVLEGNDDDEADVLRARLIDLEPGFAQEAPPPATDELRPAGGAYELDALEADDTDAPASFDEPEVPGELSATVDEEPFGIQIEPAPKGIGSAGEPLIDLSSLSIPEVDAPIGMSGLGPITDDELPDEEPIVDLEDLPTIGSAEAEEAAAPALQPMTGEPPELDDIGPTAFDEPVMDLDDLGPADGEGVTGLVAGFALPAHGDDVTMEPADLAPDDRDDVVELVDLAPATDRDEPVMDLDALAPDEPQDVVDLEDLAPAGSPGEPVMELADLAPAGEADELVMDLDALAPDEPDDVIALDDLAPEPGDEPVMDLDALAPDEPVMELADLAPPVEDVVDLADLAPAGALDQPVMELSDLAPVGEADELVMDLGDLAPEEPEDATARDDPAPEPDDDEYEDVPAVDLAAPAPDEPETIEASGEEEPVELADLAPSADLDEPDTPDDGEVTMVDLVDQTAEEEEARAHATVDDDHTPGEPVYTKTLAELYVKQGAVGQAIDVYRHLAELRPGDEGIARRIEELESGAALEETEGVLSGEAEEEVEMLARELASHGDDARHDVDSPYTLDEDGADSEAEAKAAGSGPTIDEYFQALLGWRSEKR